MEYQRIDSNKEHLEKLSRRCRAFYFLFNALFVLSIIITIGLLIFSTVLILAPSDEVKIEGSRFMMVFGTGLFGLIFILLFKILSSIFKDVYNQESPFTQTQVKRMRLIALILLAYSLLDFFAPSGQSAFVQYSEYALDYTVMQPADEATFSINVGSLAFALVTFSFSIVFEYGMELQKQTDEVL